MTQAERIAADTRVTAYQVAARLYCQKTGANPDEMLQLPHPQLAGVSVQVPLWYTIAERMFGLALLLRCISEQNRAANEGAANEGAAGA